jgi:hypothetical protein
VSEKEKKIPASKQQIKIELPNNSQISMASIILPDQFAEFVGRYGKKYLKSVSNIMKPI